MPVLDSVIKYEGTWRSLEASLSAPRAQGLLHSLLVTNVWNSVTCNWCSVWVCVCAHAHLVVSDSVRPHRPQPTRPLHPWDSPGKNTGVGCHFLLQKELQKERN